MNIPDNFHIVDHSLIKHKISILRDINTRSKEFRELTTEITSLLAYQATKDLSLSKYDIQTPITATKGYKIELDDIVLIPILRAGLGMVQGMLDLIPNARVGYVGMERDHNTHLPVDYYFKIPKKPNEKKFIVLDSNVSSLIFSKGFGHFSVSGRSRFPNPAESIIAFIIVFVNIKNELASYQLLALLLSQLQYVLGGHEQFWLYLQKMHQIQLL